MPDRLIGIVWLASVGTVLGLLVLRWVRKRQAPAARCALARMLFAPQCRVGPHGGVVDAGQRPVLAELLAWLVPSLAVADKDSRRPTPVVGGVFALMAMAVVFSLPGLARFNPLLGPAAAGRGWRMTSRRPISIWRPTTDSGNIFSHFEWGEYLAWSATPRYKVFMDGRIEVYPDDVWQKYMAVTFAKRDWEQILRRISSRLPDPRHWLPQSDRAAGPYRGFAKVAAGVSSAIGGTFCAPIRPDSPDLLSEVAY